MPGEKKIKRLVSVKNSVFCIAVGRIEMVIALRKRATANEVLHETAPRRYHTELDAILNTADLSDREVLHAWKNRALAGSGGHVTRQFTALDYSVCALFLVPLLLFVVVVVWGFITTKLSTVATVECLVALTAISVCIGLVLRQFFIPQIIAKKALQALEQHGAVRVD